MGSGSFKMSHISIASFFLRYVGAYHVYRVSVGSVLSTDQLTGIPFSQRSTTWYLFVLTDEDILDFRGHVLLVGFRSTESSGLSQRLIELTMELTFFPMHFFI